MANQHLAINRSIMEAIMYESIPQFNAIAESQLAQLNMISENTRLNAEYALMCAEAAEETRDMFRDVTNGIRKVYIN